MTTSIPSKDTKKYSSVNQGDLFGNIVRPRNLDFNRKGLMSLARKPYVFYTEIQDSGFRCPIAIVSDDVQIYVITNSDAFRLDNSSSFTISKINGGTPPNFGFQSDAVFFTSDMHASGTQSVCSFFNPTATWTSRITGLSSGFPHPLCVSEHQGYLAVGNGNSVRLYDSAYSLITTCTLPANQIATWIRWRANLLYIGCKNIIGNEAKMFIWNGSGTAVQNGYGVGCEWTMSGCEYDSTIVIVNALGQLLKFAGDGFVPLTTRDGVEANLPVYYSGIPWGSSSSTSNLVGKVASRGLQAKGKKLFMVIDSQIEFTAGHTPSTIPEMPGGLWVFDPDVGLYHKAGLDHKQRVDLQVSAVNSNILTLPTSVIFETGDPVAANSIVGLTGDIMGTTIYYAIKVDSTHLKLALTAQQAKDGQAITITGTPGVADRLAFNSYQSVGATEIGQAGGVNIISRLGMPSFTGSEVFYGGKTSNSLGVNIGTVMSLGMGKNVGSFITPKVQAQYVTDLFKKIIAKFPPLNIASRKIIIKYRNANRWGLPGRRNFGGNLSATWVTSSTFTVNPKIYDMYSVQNGDEVEFISGAAAGYTAHITNIAQDSSTQWTVTLDESMPDVLVGDLSGFLIDNWTKYKTISTSSDAKAAAKGFINATLTKKQKWVQMKVELRGYTDIDDPVQFEEISVVNGPDQKYA